jgi:hypothetical protein
LLDFFFLAVVVVAAEEFAGAGAALDCCGLCAGEAMLATFVDADAEPAYTKDARTSDAVIGSLLIFPRMSSLPRALGFQERSVERG